MTWDANETPAPPRTTAPVANAQRRCRRRSSGQVDRGDFDRRELSNFLPAVGCIGQREFCEGKTR